MFESAAYTLDIVAVIIVDRLYLLLSFALVGVGINKTSLE